LLLSVVARAELSSTVIGAPPELAANIQARLHDVPERDLASASIDLRLRRLINEACQALGYYQAEFQFGFESKGEGEGDQLRIQIEPGQPVTWGQVQATIIGAGADNEALQQAITDTPFVAGQLMHHGIYEDYKSVLLSEAQRQGYANAGFSVQRLQVDLNQHLALVQLQLDTGARYRLNRVEFFDTRIEDHVLRKLLTLESGDWYQNDMVLQLQRELLDSGYFLSADVRAQVDEASGLVDLHAYLKEEPDNRIMLGGGVATDIGVQAVFNWNRAIVNDLGHGLSLDGRVSEPLQNVAVRYTLPRQHPQRDYWEASLAWQRKDNEDTLSHLIKSGFLWRTDREDTKRSVGVNLEYEQYEQGSAPRRSTTYILPVASWDKIESPLPDSNGYRIGFNVEASSEYLGSDTDFFKTGVSGKYLWRYNPTHAFLVRAELGRIYAANLRKIPSSKRYFAGGQNSIRGYAYESISPRDPNGALTGADKLITSSLQYQWTFRQGLMLVGFVDSGKAYHDNNEPMRTGAGIGVRLSTPVGAVGIDVAVPIQDDEYDGYQLHFYLGPIL
jgi:translocation and assembly module TamA